MKKILKIVLSGIVMGVVGVSTLQIPNTTDINTNSLVVSADNIINTLDTDEDYQKVLQQNLNKIEHVNSYTAEFVVDYVTPSREYEEVVDTLNRVRELSNSLCEGLTNDYDKVKKLHDYVAENVYYDFEASEDFANLETISLKHVLEYKRTICAGYANLFSALCDAQGIYCVNVRGSVWTNDNTNIALDNAPTNHEWTAVWLDSESRWVYVDCTWDSRNRYYSEDDVETGSFVNTYFDVSVENISKNHKAKIVDYRDFFDAVNYFTTEDNTSQNANLDSTTNGSVTTSTTTDTTNTTTTNTTSDSTNANTDSDTTSQAQPLEEQLLTTAENTTDTTPDIKSVLVCAMATLMGIMFTGVKHKGK
jgi:transglutaminase-like putative cysteine protease